MLYALGLITELTTLSGEPYEICEFLNPEGEFCKGIQGAAIYNEKEAKKLARRHRCRIVPIHPDYADELNLIEV